MQRFLHFIKSTIKMDLALAGALISIAGVITTYLIQRQQNEDALKVNQQLQATIQQQAKELQEMAEYQKGGDGWGLLNFVQNPQGGYDVDFQPKGSSPMYNIKINVFDRAIVSGARYVKAPDYKIDETSPKEPFISLGTIDKQLGREKTFFVSFNARHREWTEVFQYKKLSDPTPTESGHYQIHIKVYEGYGIEGKVIYDHTALWHF